MLHKDENDESVEKTAIKTLCQRFLGSSCILKKKKKFFKSLYF